MKKLLLIISLFYITPLIAQIPDYFSGNPKWCLERLWVEDQGGCIHTINQVHYINGDTTFNNIPYKKLYTRGINYGCGSTVEVYNYIEDYLRQEGEKIYRYYSDIDSEHILYDFSLEIGDTIPYGGINSNIPLGDQIFPNSNTGKTYIINNIDSIFLQNNYYKRIFFSVFNTLSGFEVGPISDAGPDYYLEGIGHQFGFVWQYRSIGEGEFFGLFAFSKGDTLYYEFQENGGASSCDFSVSIDENTVNQLILDLYPNPAHDVLYLNAFKNIQLKSLSIYSMSGQKIIQQNGSAYSNYTIDVSQLHNGIYLLEAISSDGYKEVRRFVVE